MSLENSKYCKVEYWNERYLSEEEYDWLGDYKSLSPILSASIPDRNVRILVLGCGNSTFSSDMYEDGYRDIVNTDISEICIDKMAQLHKDKNMKWIVADATSLKNFEESSFDVVIEKATIDAFLVNEKSPWRMSKEGQILVQKCLTAVSRVLKNNGVFISITLSPAHFRGPLLALPIYNWSVDYKVFWSKCSLPSYVFVMQKGRPLTEEAIKQCSYQSNLRLLENEDFESDCDDSNFLANIDVIS